jgi:hypothetical protein
VGAATQRYSADEEVLGTSGVKEFHLSFDATREAGFARAEAQLQNYGNDHFYAGYVQLGRRLTPRLLVTLESQRSVDMPRYALDTDDADLPSRFAWHRSDGVAAAYALAPTLVLKAEHRWDRGIQLEQPGDPRNPPRFRYVMASVSASF